MDGSQFTETKNKQFPLCLFTSWVKVLFHLPQLLSFPFSFPFSFLLPFSFLSLSFQAPLPCTHAGKDHETPWRSVSPVWTAAGGQCPLPWGSKQPQVPQGLSVVGSIVRGPECDGNPHEEVWRGPGTEGTGHPSVQGEVCVQRGSHLKHGSYIFVKATIAFLTYL